MTSPTPDFLNDLSDGGRRQTNAADATGADINTAQPASSVDSGTASGPKHGEREPAVDAMPEWFARKRQQQAPAQIETSVPPKRSGRVQAAKSIRLRVDADEHQTLSEKLKRGLIDGTATGYLVSLLFHSCVVVVLSFVIVKGMTGEGDINTLMTQNESETVEIDEIDTSMTSLGTEIEVLQPPQFQVVPVPADIVQPAIPSDLLENMAPVPSEGRGDDEGEGRGGLLSAPKSGKAVTKGSFTVWTVPEDPGPLEDYTIVIQIQVPSRIRRYPRRDLSGIVIGTDGYRKYLPGQGRSILPMRNHEAQLQVKIPGGSRLVRDTIRIESHLLDEKQEIEIIF